MTNRKLTALGLLSLALCSASVALAIAHPFPSARGGQVAISAVTLVALFGVGLYAWQRHGDGHFGRLLWALGLCWFFASLANVNVSFLYSLGQSFGFVFEVVLTYALLSFPTGRLGPGWARRIVIGTALVVAILYLPTIPLDEQFRVPTPYTSCTSDCPQNYFFAGSEPAFLEAVEGLREGLAVILCFGAVLVLGDRLWRAGHNQRRTTGLVLGVGILREASLGVLIVLELVGGTPIDEDTAALIALLGISAIAFGFLIGLVQWRVYYASALSRLTTGLGEAGNPGQLRDLVVSALEEPAADLYYADPPPSRAGPPPPWRDASGRVSPLPVAPPGAYVRQADADSGLRVALVCVDSFRDYPDFLDAVCACLLSGLERQRLDSALSSSLADVAASRKRLAGAADTARQKIERDLHDGAQQHLVALRVKLELAREALAQESAEGAQLVDGLGTEVEEIIEEVRALARGIYPSLLASDGLGEALRAAGQRSPVPVTIEVDGVGRLPSETESAIYFCCLEALQNVAKHADGATAVRVVLAADDQLSFEVSDDGDGFEAEATNGGSGIIGMRDRLAAVGGELWVDSAPGAGTRVRGRVPLA